MPIEMNNDQFVSAMREMRAKNQSVINDWDRKLTRIRLTNPYSQQNPLAGRFHESTRGVLVTRNPSPPNDFDPVPLVVAL